MKWADPASVTFYSWRRDLSVPVRWSWEEILIRVLPVRWVHLPLASGASDLAASLALGENWFRVPETIRIVFSGKLPEWTSGKDLALLLLKELGMEGARYKALEFGGETIESLPVADRITICNMAGETGAKNAIIEPDQVTCEFLRERGIDATDSIKSDNDAAYASVLEFRVDDLEPLVATPSLPSNVKRARELESVKLDQVFIGSCTNGSLEDFRRAAKLLKGRKVHESVRLIAIPGTPKTLSNMIDEGIAKTFLEAGAALGPCTCGPCAGAHMGVLAANEVALSTSNRNFVGRMGHPTSQLYLASPVVAAASAILGRIADPRELGGQHDARQRNQVRRQHRYGRDHSHPPPYPL